MSNIYNILKTDALDNKDDNWRIVSKTKNHNVGVKYQSFQGVKKKNDKEKNQKTILCINMISKGSCPYGSKCAYAHTLDEQIIKTHRKRAYEIVMSKSDLSNIDLQKDHDLYRALLELSVLCPECLKGICTGGYNCNKGVYTKKYQVCAIDLNDGNCVEKCGKIHLTLRNLLHFRRKNVQGIQLTVDFFNKLQMNNNKDEINEDNLSEFDKSDDDISIDKTDDINNDSDECDKSIFD